MTEMAGAAKVATDAAQATAKVVETGLRKIWSIMDAASEKKLPGEVMSQRGIQAMQGKVKG